MARDQVFELFAHRPATAFGALAVDDHGQRIHRFVIDQDGHFHQIAFFVFLDVIIEAGIAARHAFQPVIEIEHHFIQRQQVDHHGAIAGIGQFDLPSAPVFAQFQNAAEIFVRHQDGRLDPGFFDMIDIGHIGHIGGIVQLLHRAVIHIDVIDH